MKKRILLLGFLLTILVAGCARTVPPGAEAGPSDVQSGEQIKWVDVHVHPSTNIVDLDLAGGSIEDFTVCYTSDCVDPYIPIMDSVSNEYAIFMSAPSTHEKMDTEEKISQVAEMYPERLGYMGGGAILNPIIQQADEDGVVTDEVREEFEATARSLIEDYGALGFGEMAVLHLSASASHPYEEVPANHELYLLLADIAAEYGVPIDIHMDPVAGDFPTPEQFLERSENNPDVLVGNIAGLEELLDHNPNAIISLAHTADTTGHLTPELVEGLLAEHPNLYLSLRVEIFQRAMADRHPLLDTNGNVDSEWLALFEKYPDRFFIGSDTFMAGIEEPGRTQSPVQSFLAQLSDDTAKKIACENAVEIYNLQVSCE